MCCVEFLKDFYNDHYFETKKNEKYLPAVIQVTFEMLAICENSKHYECVNEVLELLRFVSEKHASMKYSYYS
jgi:hypothetical protein